MKENPPYFVHGERYKSPFTKEMDATTIKGAILEAHDAVDWNTYAPDYITDKDGNIVADEQELPDLMEKVYEEREAKRAR